MIEETQKNKWCKRLQYIFAQFIQIFGYAIYQLVKRLHEFYILFIQSVDILFFDE